MPRFGHINERRNQLHEVIRLSGMNLIINDLDHPLIIKVASIQSARMQVYFIDNDDYFQRKLAFRDKNGKFQADNDERAIFYARGVLETVKKLGWAPDIVHCHGWFTSLVPLYLKKIFYENPIFSDAKIVYSIYNDGFEEKLDSEFPQKLTMEGLKNEDLSHYSTHDYVGLTKSAIDLSDAVIIGDTAIDLEISKYISKIDKPVLPYFEIHEIADKYNDLYNDLLKIKE
jgi:starch synthase